MDIIEPTNNDSIRKHIPKIVDEINLETIDKNIKPGFYQQSHAFSELIKNKKIETTASLIDALNVVKISEQLIEKSFQKFARESVVSITNISKGEIFSEKNITTKRPGTGGIPASDFYKILGKFAKRDISNNTQLSKKDVC